MRIFKHFTRRPLFKPKHAEAPDYATFQLLLEKHNNTVNVPLISHYRNSYMKLLVYSYRNNLNLLTQDNYEKAVNNISAVEDVVTQWYRALPYDKQFVITYTFIKSPALSTEELSRNISKSKTTVRRYISSSLEELFEIIHLNLFNNVPSIKRDLRSDKIFVDKRYEAFTRPISNDTDGRELISYLNKVCELNWELPKDDDALAWQPLCIAVGRMFNLVSLKIAIGARILLTGGSHQYVWQVRQSLHIDKPDKPVSNYRHNKRAFIKYIKEHTAEANAILWEVIDNGNYTNLHK